MRQKVQEVYKKDFEEFGVWEHFKNALETKKETMIFLLNEQQFYLLLKTCSKEFSLPNFEESTYILTAQN